MHVIMFFGCFLLLVGSAWAQLGEGGWNPVQQVQATSPSLHSFDSWYQHQRNRHRQQHERYRLETQPLQPNPPMYSYEPRSVPSDANSAEGFDGWYQQQRDRHRQQHERYQQEARQQELKQKRRLQDFNRLRQEPLQPY